MDKMHVEPRIQEELENIEQLRESRYMTRTELMEHINFPSNSPNLIVIKSNDKGIGFLKTMYDSRYCAGVISKDEFDSIIERASNLMGKVYSKKRNMDTQGVPIWYKLSLFLSLLIAFAFLVMAYYLPEYDLWYQILTFALLGVCIVIVSFISLINFCKRTDSVETYEEMVLDRVGDYFYKLNQNGFIDRGMEWFLVPGHYWLELRINKRSNNFVSNERESNNVYTTNIDTVENRLNGPSKGQSRKEELKTETPFQNDVSREGKLSDLLSDSEEDD